MMFRIAPAMARPFDHVLRPLSGRPFCHGGKLAIGSKDYVMQVDMDVDQELPNGICPGCWSRAKKHLEAVAAQ